MSSKEGQSGENETRRRRHLWRRYLIGALFACIACLESLMGSLSFATYNSIYGATVVWFPGFSFLLSAFLSLIPFAVVWILYCIRYEETDHVLLINEESTNEVQPSNSI